MRLKETDFPEVKIIFPEIIHDTRGCLSEVYDKLAFSKLGIDLEFVQDVCSVSIKSGTIRGLHYQVHPYAQAKLLRVTQGRIFDVILDIRPSTPSFGQHIALELDAADKSTVFIPTGFAHGFCSLTDNVEISYKLSKHFSPGHSRGIRWNDPELNINWPVEAAAAIVSEKDAVLPLLEAIIQ